MVRVVGILNVEGPFFVTQPDSSARQRSASWVESMLRTLFMLIGEPELWNDDTDRTEMDRCSDSIDEVSSVAQPVWVGVHDRRYSEVSYDEQLPSTLLLEGACKE